MTDDLPTALAEVIAAVADTAPRPRDRIDALVTLCAGFDASGAAFTQAALNVALNRPTSASSQDYGAAALANNGNTANTFPLVFQTGLDVTPFWIVDLGAAYTLSRVRIYQRSDDEDAGLRRLHDWTLTLFSGGTLASPSGVVTSNTYNAGAGSVPATLNFDVTNGVAGRVARFLRISLAATDYLSLAEVEVYVQPFAGALATAGPVVIAARRLAAIALAEACSAYEPASYDDAVEVMTVVAGILDAEILVAGDAGQDGAYLALRTLRAAVVDDLAARGASLAPLIRLRRDVALPSLVMAQQLYGDATRADELVKRVTPVHPAFIAGNLTLLGR